jgi:hypothetical protein
MNNLNEIITNNSQIPTNNTINVAQRGASIELAKKYKDLCTYADQINNIIVLVKGDISNMFSFNEQQQLINIHTTSKSFESQLSIDDINLIKKELSV